MHQPLATCNPEPIQSGEHRYQLWRRCIPNEALQAEQRGTVNFIMLNPSDSTVDKSDQTVHNCERLAGQWAFANLVVTNLFAYITSQPKKLLEVPVRWDRGITNI